MIIPGTVNHAGGIFAASTHPKHHRSFTIVVFCLVAALALSGCYSTYPLAWADDPAQPLPTDRSIEVTLIDKAVIEAEPSHYTEVREPSDFIFGHGELRNKRTEETSEFCGTMPLVSPERIDTVNRPKDAGWYSKMITVEEFYYPVLDSVTVRFKAGDFVTVRRDQGAGLYCAGTRTNRGESFPYIGRVPFEDISRIEEWKLDGWETAALGAGILLAAALAVVSSEFHMMGGDGFSLGNP